MRFCGRTRATLELNRAGLSSCNCDVVCRIYFEVGRLEFGVWSLMCDV